MVFVNEWRRMEEGRRMESIDGAIEYGYNA